MAQIFGHPPLQTLETRACAARMPRWGHSGTFSSRRHRCLLSTQAGGLVVGGVVGSWLASACRATRTRTHSLADQTERFARAKTEGNARYLPPLPPPPPSPSPPPTCATNLFRCSSQGRRPHRVFYAISSAPSLQAICPHTRQVPRHSDCVRRCATQGQACACHGWQQGARPRPHEGAERAGRRRCRRRP